MTQHEGKHADIVNVLNGFVAQNPNFDGLVSIFKQIEKYLHNITSGRNPFLDLTTNWSFVLDLRCLLVTVALKLITKDVVQAEQSNIENRLWMKGYYEILHGLRAKAKPSSSPVDKVLRSKLHEIFLHGVQVFSNILDEYDILLKTPRAASWDERKVQIRNESIVQSMYKIYTYMGDLHRYESLYERSIHHNKMAIRFYELAAKLIPDKYRAYHNSAVVNKSCKDAVSAAYNFVRALNLEGGDSSRQELLSLFDEWTKIYHRQKSSFWHQQSRKNQRYEGRRTYKTIWVSTDVSSLSSLPGEYDPPQFKEDHFRQMNDKEVFKRFSQSFIVFLGILFTKIGSEMLEFAAEDSLVYFEELLKRNSEYVPTLRVVQIVALIQFMIHHIQLKHKPPSHFLNEDQPGKDARTPLQSDWKVASEDRSTLGISEAQYMENVAVDFGLEMFSLMAENLGTSIRLCDWNNLLLTPMAAGVQLWEGWLRNNSNLWAFKKRKRPIFSVRRLLSSKMDNTADRDDDVWAAFAELANQVEFVVFEFSHLFPRCKTSANSKYCQRLGRLPEYMSLSGFHIFANASLMNCEYYAQADADVDLAFMHVRLVRICDFAEQLCGKVKILEIVGGWDKVNRYRSVARIVQWDKESKESCGLKESDYQHLLTKTLKNLETVHEMKMRKLKRPKPYLVSGDCNNARVILRTHVSGKEQREPRRKRMLNYELWILMAEYGYPTELVVCPKRVVLDTNCLIKDLEVIDTLIPHLRYPFLLPISVILELRGLSRGGLTNKQKKIYGSIKNPEAKEIVAKNAMIAERCKLILQYFEYRWSSFKVVTSTGTFIYPKGPFEHMQDTYFNPEDSNDERILDSCKYMEYDDLNLRKLDTPLRIFRNTVLLTGDLILSARTITLDIPTRSTSSFAHWFFSNHDLSVAKRFLWGLEYNPKEEHGLRYHARYIDWQGAGKGQGSSDEEDLSNKSKNQLRIIKAKNRKRRRNQRLRGVIHLNPQRFTL